MKQSDCTNHRSPINKPRVLDLGRVSKPRALRPSRRNGRSGATNWRESRGNVLFNAFGTVQALLLSSLRFLRPRSSRGEGAEQPRNDIDSWPQTRQFREPGQALFRARTQSVRIHEQSVSAFSPRNQARPGTGTVRGNATVATVRELATATATNYPQSVRSSERFASANWLGTQSVRERGPAKNYPRCCIAVSFLPRVGFSICLQSLSTYEFV